MSTEETEEPMDTNETGTELLKAVLEALTPIAEKWYEFGIKLGVDGSVLHSLDKQKDDRLSVLLNAWAGRDGVELVGLVEAVRNVDEETANRVAEIVKDKSVEELCKPEVKGRAQDTTADNDVGTEVKDVSEEEVKGQDEVMIPEISTQKTEIQAALRQQLKKGDTWFLVDIRWIKQWKKYVGYDTWDQSSAGKESANPGPMDNANLFKDDTLREHLMDELDYYLVPESAWNKLSAWYGLSSGSKVIARRVVEYGLYMKHCKVEVYLLEFKLCLHPQLNEFKKREFSRADTVADLESAMKEVFELPSSSECRVWHRYMTHTYELLAKSDQSLQDAGLYNGQTIVLEKKNEDGSWPRATSTVSSATHSTRSSDDATGGSTSSSRSTGGSYSYSGSYWSSSYNQQPSNPGLCGLSNLGNTCFMNSALQCLSNTAPLTDYFVRTQSGYKPYKKHVNKDNPLGMGGAIAEAYGALLDEIWGGKVSVTAPRQFKTQVGRYAPQFVGYAQHDSQELLAFLLDGLHEDLNLVKKKPYVDMTVEIKDREEKDIAEESWFKYLKRNQSVIVKFFQGQLRSTLVCPECQGVSKTFDPFMFLSLPLPIKKTRTISVYLVRIDPSAPIVKYKLKVTKRGCVWDLKTALGERSGVEAGHLAVVDVYNSRFHRIYSDRDSLSTITDRDDIYCYQLQAEETKRKMVHVPVYMRAETERHYSYQQYSRYYNLFGLPTVAYVPAECTYRTLYTAIVSKMGRYVKLWSEVKDKETKNETEEDTNKGEETDNGNEDTQNRNETSENGNQTTENAKESSADPPTVEEEKMETDEQAEAPNNEEKNKDVGERDLFRLVVVNSYGSQEIKKLVDDPKKTLSLSGSTYIACDWDIEVKDKCYDEEATKEYEEHESCHDDPEAKSKNIQLMNCFELFTVKETLGKEDEWYCPTCKEHVQASKKFDLWTTPEILVIHLKRFSYDRYWRDKLDVLVDFPVTGLNLSDLVLCPDSPEAVYDLYAVSNHFGGMGGGHYTAYAKNKDTNKWYNFDDSHVSETTEDRLVTAAAYVLFYRRRSDQNRPSRREKLDRSLSQSFDEVGKQLKAKYHGGSEGEEEDQDSKRSKNEEVFPEEDENMNNSEQATSSNMDEPD